MEYEVRPLTEEKALIQQKINRAGEADLTQTPYKKKAGLIALLFTFPLQFTSAAGWPARSRPAPRR